LPIDAPLVDTNNFERSKYDQTGLVYFQFSTKMGQRVPESSIKVFEINIDIRIRIRIYV